jgi:hypothetical protein
VPKLADFGYSTIVRGDKPVKVSISKPWTDPKYGGELIDFETAKKMDSYSFGSVCAWLLITLVPTAINLHGSKSTSPLEMIQKFVIFGRVEELVKQYTEIPEMSSAMCLSMTKLLQLSLEAKSADRSADFNHFLELLDGSRYVFRSFDILHVMTDFD